MHYTPGSTFSHAGFDLAVIDRRGDVVLCSKVCRQTGWKSHEVAIVAPYGPRSILGRDVPAGESYPSSEQWGTRGWTLREEPEARRRFEETCEKRRSLLDFDTVAVSPAEMTQMVRQTEEGREAFEALEKKLVEVAKAIEDENPDLGF